MRMIYTTYQLCFMDLCSRVFPHYAHDSRECGGDAFSCVSTMHM